MTVVAGTHSLDRSLGRLFAVVGVFDGLHLGHDYLLRELRLAAAGRGARPAVITFDHHPDEVLKGAAPPLLCDPDERLDRLAAAGVQVTVIETFDVALRETPYDAWIREIAERLDLAGLLMTPESAFGYERRGTPETVAELGRRLGYEVVVVPQFTLDGEPIRSSDIRAAIASGDLARAARLLGRQPTAVGVARLAPDGSSTLMDPALPIALPPAGSYEADVRAGDRAWARALQIADGRIAVRPAVDIPDGMRIQASFAVTDLVHETGSAGNIRRS